MDDVIPEDIKKAAAFCKAVELENKVREAIAEILKKLNRSNLPIQIGRAHV